MRGEVDGATVPVRERLQAAAMILDRGWGKPTQRVQVGRTAKLSAAFGLDGLSDDAQDGPAH
jgi:hypothetical protein